MKIKSMNANRWTTNQILFAIYVENELNGFDLIYIRHVCLEWYWFTFALNAIPAM